MVYRFAGFADGATLASPTADLPDAEPRDLLAPGAHDVHAHVVCVITRFTLRSVLFVPAAYLTFRRLQRRAALITGLLRSEVFVETPTVFYGVSIWASDDVLPSVDSPAYVHVEFPRAVLGLLRRSDQGVPDLRSTKWRLQGVSRNLNWNDFDLRSLVAPNGSLSLAGPLR